MSTDRRSFVSAALLGGLIAKLPPLKGADTTPARRLASVSDDLEPLVRMIEGSPRDQAVEKAVAAIKDGTGYDDLLAAVFLAGCRGIQPRPVGFKFHAVLVVNSAHQAALAASDKERWLPLLWTIDNFKSSQERNKKEGDWRLAPAPAKLPSPADAGKELQAGLDAWDEEKTDAAVTALAREEGGAATFARLWFYACRDFRDIGHKSIYAAGAYRMLHTIGWRHSEPVLRSLAYALLDHSREANPAKADLAPDRPGKANLPRARKLAASLHGKKDGAPLELLAFLRGANADAASKEVERLLTAEVRPQAIWDGLFLTAGELLLRQPGIVALHAMTSLNALHFIYRTAAEPWQRSFALLQAGAYAALFREALPGRGKVADHKLDKLEKADPTKGRVEDVLAKIRKQPVEAARLALGLDAAGARKLMAAARTLVFAKGPDSHDYKFSSALFEDYHHVSPAHRPLFLAAGTGWLRGSGEGDTPLFKRVKAALA